MDTWLLQKGDGAVRAQIARISVPVVLIPASLLVLLPACWAAEVGVLEKAGAHGIAFWESDQCQFAVQATAQCEATATRLQGHWGAISGMCLSRSR